MKYDQASCQKSSVINAFSPPSPLTAATAPPATTLHTKSSSTVPPVGARHNPSRPSAAERLPSPDLLASAFRIAAPNGTIDVPIIARALGITEVQMERLVLRSYGVSARHLLLITRLDLAHDKLRLDPLAPVSEVATAYGFADAIAFGRAFVDRFGTTPLEVRGTGGRQAPWPRASRLNTL